MRIIAIIALHLIPLAFALSGQWIIAIMFTVLLHFTILFGTLIPPFPLFGKLIKRTPDLPPGVATPDSVLLTFDDGPHPEFTPQILELLDEYETRAVFFVIGEKAAQHPDIIRDIAARGHLIGNHTQTHPSHRFWRIFAREAAAEIDECQRTIETLTGTRPIMFRPPVGMHNPFVFDALQRRALPCIMWSHRGFDTTSRDIATIVKRLTDTTAPGAILMIHDHLPRSVEITRRTLETLRSRGLTLAAKS